MKRALKLLLTASVAFASMPGLSQDLLHEGFQNPPQEARPRVWWHWLNGAISEQGIKQDLDWLHRSGIGGVQIFYGAMPNNDGVVTPPVRYMSPEWKTAFRSAVAQAADKGMEVTIPTSAGWSETGAPFVKAADGMKKFVWTESDVVGGRRFQGILPRPSDASGPIGGIEFGENRLTHGAIGPQPPRLYVDSRVIAYHVPATEPLPKVTTSKGEVPAAGLFDRRLVKAIEIDRPSNKNPGWVRFDYPRPVTLRSLTVVLEPKKPEIAVSTEIPAWLEVSEDGVTFRKVADITAGSFTQNTNSFAPVTGRIFRVVLQPAPATLPALDMAPGALLQPGLALSPPGKMLTISEMALSSDARIERFEEKAGFASLPDYYAVPTPAVGPRDVIDRLSVIDLTSRMKADGTLDWTPPKGRWRVVRLGYSLTGHMNGPTTAEATGLEVDKLSAPRVQAFMKQYLDEYAQTLGPDLVGKRGLQATLNDSIEAGFQNWTDDILDQFAKRRGYDPAPWLPVLTGRIVDSAAASDAFLYDFRRTLTDLMAEAHYGSVAQIAHARGLTAYGEALEAPNRPSLGDDLAMRSHADVPMGAMWMFKPGRGPQPAHAADIKGAASAAHLYGRTYVGAESMSSMFQYWAASPRELKHVADTEFALGVNRFSIHSSVHQPLIDKAPGLSLWLFGQYFNRNESWAEQARPWVDYLARTSWMLSQGRYAADVAYFYGEEAPIVTLADQGRLKDAPTRYGYDFINADALAGLTSVKDGTIVTPSGMRYRVLQLGGASQRITLPTLRRIAELVEAGAVVVGDKPSSSPSLADDIGAFKVLADRLWSGGPETRVGAGRVLSAMPVEAAFARIGVTPDQEVLGQAGNALRFLHRVLDEGDLWFVSNPEGNAFTGDVAFRATGRAPELWDAETGTNSPLSYRTENGRTIVPLRLAGSGSALIVFRQPTDQTTRTVTPPAERTLATIDGHWSVTFQPGRGAPEGAVKMPAGSWTDSKETGIRYFSGVATYSRTVRVPRTKAGSRTILSLGEVNDLAELWVNGTHVRTLWHAPYRADVTDALRRGDNRFEIKVANRWVNRLIGDAQPRAAKIGWIVAPAYSAKAPLLPSGLKGPVTLIETHN
jgi:hypothetical protein